MEEGICSSCGEDTTICPSCYNCGNCGCECGSDDYDNYGDESDS